MLVYFLIFLPSQSVHVRVQQHHNERVEQVKEEPCIHHLHVGGLGQAVTDVDEHRRQHQHRGQVHSDYGLKLEILTQ